MTRRIRRFLTADTLAAESCFLWGPRQTGKSTLLRDLFPNAPAYDLLSAREFRRLSADPGLLFQECAALPDRRQPVIIDEIQKLPELLDEVHSLMSRHGLRFILTGSSPRKLMRGGGNLLGGRALRSSAFSRQRPCPTVRSSTRRRSRGKSASLQTRCGATSRCSWTRSWRHGSHLGPNA